MNLEYLRAIMKSEINRIVGNSGKFFFLLGIFLGTGMYIAGCGGRGDTANNGDPNAGTGSQYVAPEGGGSTLRLELEGSGNELQVSQRRGFKITAVDPTGNPLSNIRIFCESEKGISILEPSSGGVAFAHTNSRGIMSGIIGGLLPGSYMIECRAPHGFDLYARTHIRVTGDVPEGFAGFPGAAGGNLGGGAVIAPPVGQDIAVVEVLFTTVSNQTPTRVADIDLIQGMCPIVNPTGPEIFGPDNFVMSVQNTLTSRISVTSVTIEVPNGAGGTVVSEQQLGGLVIQANSNAEFTGPFTDTGSGSKLFAGTSVPVPVGTHNIRFTVTFETFSGETTTVEHFTTIRAFNVNAC
jgi:hypothetical protein